MIIDKRKLIRWECLANYFSEHEGRMLDMIFANPLCHDEERVKILDNLDVTVKQKEFLLRVFDIDYIYIQNKKLMLIEEKTKNIQGEKFLEGNYIYLDHGTSTEYQHLKEAHDLGIEAGILLSCVKFKRESTGLLSYAFMADGNRVHRFKVHRQVKPVAQFPCLDGSSNS